MYKGQKQNLHLYNNSYNLQINLYEYELETQSKVCQLSFVNNCTKKNKSKIILLIELKIKIQNHMKRTKSLMESIVAVGDCEDMSEQAIRKNLL